MVSEIDVRMSEHDLTAILEAPGWEALRQQVLHLLAGTGMCDFMIRIDVGDGASAGAAHNFGSLPATLLHQFGSTLKDEEDPVNRHVARSGLPLEWRTDDLAGRPGGAAYAALRELGIGAGISMMARDALAVSRVNFYRRPAAGRAGSAAPTADLMLLGSYLHEAVRGLWNRQYSQSQPSLTGREQACLYWSAVGKTSKETATILSISHHTVYFHLKNAARKLNVYSTRHAINRATQLGMIEGVGSAVV
jgi:DNA-binding CsgD family transcriptional regulator